MNDIFDYGYTFLQDHDRLSDYYLLLVIFLCFMVMIGSMISYPNTIRLSGTIHHAKDNYQISYITRTDNIPQILKAELRLFDQVYPYQVVEVVSISDQGYYKVILQGEEMENTWGEGMQVTLTFELGKTTFYEQIKKKMKGWFLLEICKYLN